ncbi:MAG: uracil-DNA glycosylase [Clostridia bacterium]|nr:uracil-DNA glycosylase [Clostridia bacterium]
MVHIGNDWDGVLLPLFESENYKKIRSFLKSEYQNYTIYPNMYDIFNCFKLTPYSKVKVVILGQDPYHEVGQAQGVCFSVPNGIKLPPSLQNIFKELKSDLGYTAPNCGDLTKWAKEGVLLLNTVLTVREGQANSHKNCGWMTFTDEVIKLISNKKEPVVFILWGGNARSKKQLIAKHHHIIESAHPSPLSAYNGFFGSKPFSKANEYLIKENLAPIDWQL